MSCLFLFLWPSSSLAQVVLYKLILSWIYNWVCLTCNIISFYYIFNDVAKKSLLAFKYFHLLLKYLPSLSTIILVIIHLSSTSQLITFVVLLPYLLGSFSKGEAFHTHSRQVDMSWPHTSFKMNTTQDTVTHWRR